MKHDERFLKILIDESRECFECGEPDGEKVAKAYAEHLNRWIVAKDETPPTDRPFLAVVEGFVYIAEYEEIYDSDTDTNSNTPTYWIAEHRDRNIKVASGRLTHWQDLIEPPETK